MRARTRQYPTKSQPTCSTPEQQQAIENLRRDINKLLRQEGKTVFASAGSILLHILVLKQVYESYSQMVEFGFVCAAMDLDVQQAEQGEFPVDGPSDIEIRNILANAYNIFYNCVGKQKPSNWLAKLGNSPILEAQEIVKGAQEECITHIGMMYQLVVPIHRLLTKYIYDNGASLEGGKGMGARHIKWVLYILSTLAGPALKLGLNSPTSRYYPTTYSQLSDTSSRIYHRYSTIFDKDPKHYVSINADVSDLDAKEAGDLIARLEARKQHLVWRTQLQVQLARYLLGITFLYLIYDFLVSTKTFSSDMSVIVFAVLMSALTNITEDYRAYWRRQQRNDQLNVLIIFLKDILPAGTSLQHDKQQHVFNIHFLTGSEEALDPIIVAQIVKNILLKHNIKLKKEGDDAYKLADSTKVDTKKQTQIKKEINAEIALQQNIKKLSKQLKDLMKVINKDVELRDEFDDADPTQGKQLVPIFYIYPDQYSKDVESVLEELYPGQIRKCKDALVITVKSDMHFPSAEALKSAADKVKVLKPKEGSGETKFADTMDKSDNNNNNARSIAEKGEARTQDAIKQSKGKEAVAAQPVTVRATWSKLNTRTAEDLVYDSSQEDCAIKPVWKRRRENEKKCYYSLSNLSDADYGKCSDEEKSIFEDIVENPSFASREFRTPGIKRLKFFIEMVDPIKKEIFSATHEVKTLQKGGTRVYCEAIENDQGDTLIIWKRVGAHL